MNRKIDTPSYSNFDIAIRSWNGKHYPTHVLKSPAGEASGILDFSTLAPDIITSLQHLRDLVLVHEEQSNVLSNKKTRAYELGELLFDALMSGEIRSSFDISHNLCPTGLRIRLRIDPKEIAILPWELMVDRRMRKFLSLSVHTPIVRYVELPKGIAPLSIARPLNILLVVSNPTDAPPLNVKAEVNNARMSLNRLTANKSARIIVEDHANLLSIQRRLRENEIHVFHFIGHGYYSESGEEGYIVFEDSDRKSQLVSGRKLGRLLNDESSLRLAILNACVTGQHSETDSFSGAASAIVQAGVPAVIAMQSEITDLAALQFSQVFYEAISDGYPVDAAVAEGRRSVDFSSDETVEWAIPQLFMRSDDGLLFEFVSTNSQPPDRGSRKPFDEPTCASSTLDHQSSFEHSKSKKRNLPPKSDKMLLVSESEFMYRNGETLFLPDFYIDPYPVTNKEFYRYVNETGAKCPPQWKNNRYPLGSEDFPVTNISWYDAVAYAKWQNKRLPTEAEWEKAARGTKGFQYPWGMEFDKTKCNTKEALQNGLVSVKFYPDNVSPFGVTGMFGNVWEWTSDELRARGIGVKKTKRIVKGVAWDSPGISMNCLSRSQYWPDDTRQNIGFRCISQP